MPEKEQPARNASIWVKLFVAFHICAITIWALPTPLDVMSGAREPVGTEWILVWNQRHLKTFQPVPVYLFVTGFWQYWDMFSPNPAQVDYWCDAEVDYKDGTSKIYQYPRMYKLSIAQKFISERYRKFYERVSQPKYNYLWPVFAQRIAHLNDDPANPPVSIKLRTHSLAIAPPGVPQKQDYTVSQYFIYIVDQRRLADDRKGIW